MATIKTKNVTVKNAVNVMIDIVKSSGGFVHPSLVFNERAGELTVSIVSKSRTSEPVLNVPISCMPLWEQFFLAYNGKQISCEVLHSNQLPEGIEEASDIQLHVMLAILSIYNELGKIEQYCKNSPISIFKGDRKVLEMFQQREPGLAQLLLIDDIHEFQLKCYLQSRVYQDMSTGRHWLLPLIDFVDHHSFADAFRPALDANSNKSLQLSSLAVNKSTGLMASYSLMDCFHSWVKYGFVDKSAFFVQSIPFSIDLDAGGTIHFHAIAVNNAQLNPASWNAQSKEAYFYAARHDLIKGILDVGFLLIPPAKHFTAFSEVIMLYLQKIESVCGMAAGSLCSVSQVTKIQHKAVKVNTAFYKELHGALKQQKNMKESDLKVAQKMIAQQMNIIKQFK